MSLFYFPTFFCIFFHFSYFSYFFFISRKYFWFFEIWRFLCFRFYRLPPSINYISSFYLNLLSHSLRELRRHRRSLNRKESGYRLSATVDGTKHSSIVLRCNHIKNLLCFLYLYKSVLFRELLSACNPGVSWVRWRSRGPSSPSWSWMGWWTTNRSPAQQRGKPWNSSCLGFLNVNMWDFS